MTATTIWHYMPQTLWMYEIEHQGLRPRADILTIDNGSKGIPDFARQKYLFGLLEPRPESWRKNKEFPGIWRKLIHHVKHGDWIIMRCAFDLAEGDDVRVVDWAHMERVRPEIRKLNLLIASERDRIRIMEANMEYIHSAVGVQDYRGGYSLPEVIVGNPIPRSRLKEADIYHTTA